MEMKKTLEIPEGDHVGHHPMAVVALGDDDAGEETTERQREAERLGDIGHPEADQQRPQHEHFADARTHQVVEQLRHQVPRHHEDQTDRQDTSSEAQGHGARGGLDGTRQNRSQHDHRNDQEVLKEQDPDDHLPLRRLHLAPLVVELEHHRGARQGDDEAEEERLEAGKAEGQPEQRGE